jgi:RNA polymerase sigma factor (sigma-70 family)
MSDRECLQLYLRDGSQTAFAALVARHIDLVYSAALRQVRSPQLAEEVAQSVFIDLARQAATLDAREPLGAWLYVVTRRTAVDVIRRESRRQERERIAAEIAAMKTPPQAWPHVERSLDAAMATLSDTERAALVLRFFQNLSLREVGESLGISEDTAQKRVSRALDRLRAFFQRRGVAVSAAALVAELPAHSVQAAPTGLGAAVASRIASAAASAGGIAALKTTEALVMTSLQKSLLATAFAVALGAGVYEASVLRAQAAALRASRAASTALQAELAAARAGHAATARRLAAVEQHIDARLAAARLPAADPALEAQAREWLAQLERLRQAFARWPELDTPALRLLKEQDWFDVAAARTLQTDADLRRATAELRRTADGRVAARLQRALASWLASHGGQPPAQPADLAPLCDPPLDPAIFDRYEMLSTPRPGMNAMIATKTPVDPELDGFTTIGPGGYGSGSAMNENVREAQRRYAEANNGQRATTAVQLQPFLKWPVSLEALQKYLSPGGAR